MADDSDPLANAEELQGVAQNLARPAEEVCAKVAAWMETGNAPMVQRAQAHLPAFARACFEWLKPGREVVCPHDSSSWHRRAPCSEGSPPVASAHAW